MDFFIQDNIVGLEFTGLSGMILLIYLIIESMFFYHTKTLIIQNLIVHNIVKRKLNKYISKMRTLDSTWWILKSLEIHGNGFLKYKAWVKIEMINTSGETSCWVDVNRLLIFNLDNLKEQMDYYESAIPKSKRKSIKRNNILDELGI